VGAVCACARVCVLAALHPMRLRIDSPAPVIGGPDTHNRQGSSKDRCPVLEWEEQNGYGWAWSWVYRADWGLLHPFTEVRAADST
jgi:hypothetical protein